MTYKMIIDTKQKGNTYKEYVIIIRENYIVLD
jgi:hypothetical protein